MGTRLFNIYGGIDDWHDTINEDFYFSTIYADKLVDPNEAWQVGYELVSLFNGARLIFGDTSLYGFQPVKLAAVLHNKVEVRAFESEERYAFLPPPPLSITERFSELDALGGDCPLKFLVIATDHEDVYAILKYGVGANSFAGLYKLMETVEHVARKSSIAIPDTVCPPRVRNDFTYSANAPHASRLEARHGLSNKKPAKANTAMSLDEASKFVCGLASHVLLQLGDRWAKQAGAC